MASKKKTMPKVSKSSKNAPKGGSKFSGKVPPFKKNKEIC